MAAMGPDVLITVALAAGLVLFLSSRWVQKQRDDVERLEPPPGFRDPVGTWEQEVLAAQAAQALAASRTTSAADGAPPAGGGSRALDDVAAQAVLLQRHVPPRREARSHWGGLPTLPPELGWPSYTDRTGAERPLSFLVQVACEEVPPTGRLGLLPDRGTLFFFAEMAWGYDWQWRCLYAPEDRGGHPSAPPATLPPLYDSREVWSWPQADVDWPRLLPHWSFTPVLATAAADPADVPDGEAHLWPGRLDVDRSLDVIPGAVAPEHLGDPHDGTPWRPYDSFPHDWRAVLISFGHLAQALAYGAGRGTDAGTPSPLRAAVSDWTARARTHAPDEPLDQDESDRAWADLTLDHRAARSALRDAVPDAVDATLSLHPDPMSVLPEEALDLARWRHSLARTYKGERYANLHQRMLAPPTCVQVEADERASEWLLLLEVSHDPSVGHHLSEGVLQFWIRPDDLAARRFDRVELSAEAY